MYVKRKTNIVINTLSDLKRYYGEDDLRKCDIYFIIEHFELTEYFIEEHIFSLYPHYIDLEWELPRLQQMSIDFIDKHIEKFNMNVVVRIQKLDNDFLVKHIENIDYDLLLLNQTIDWQSIDEAGVDVILKMFKKEQKEYEF